MRRGLVAAALCLALGTAGAQTPEVTALREEVARLHADLARVEARLEKLAAAGPVPAATAGAAAPVATVATAAAVAPAATVAPQAVVAPRAMVAGSAGTPAAAPSLSPAEARRVAWRGLKEGQSEAEVEALLGPPTKRFELSGKQVSYYYYQGVGAGSVFFDGTGRISSVQRPPG